MEEHIRFSSFGGYRRFCGYWWRDLRRAVTTGWLYDVRAYWHRARYGWAPRDTWSLDHYVAGVLGGALYHLADKSNGAPAGYPRTTPATDETGDVVTDFYQWRDDLYRWADAFAAYARDDYHELHGHKPTFDDWHSDEQRRRENLHRALKEIEPWFPALWN